MICDVSFRALHTELSSFSDLQFGIVRFVLCSFKDSFARKGQHNGLA